MTPQDQLRTVCEKLSDKTQPPTYEDLEQAIEAAQRVRKALKEQEQNRQRQAQQEDGVLYIPKELKRVPPQAFRNLQDITKVVFAPGITEIGEFAFSGCRNLKEVVFPDNRVMLRRCCFSGCTALKKVDIPAVSCIGVEAFSGCTRLESVTLPDSLSQIYSQAFRDCRSLRTVTFAKVGEKIGYTSISSQAFWNCTSLESIEIPPRTGVDFEAFRDCKKLKTIYLHDAWNQPRKFYRCDAVTIRLEDKK